MESSVAAPSALKNSGQSDLEIYLCGWRATAPTSLRQLSICFASRSMPSTQIQILCLSRVVRVVFCHPHPRCSIQHRIRAFGVVSAGTMASGSADQLGVLDDSASEYVAERLAKTGISDGSEGGSGAAGEGPLNVVGEGSLAGPGPGGASRPGEPGTGHLGGPANPTEQTEAEAEEDLDVELLLSRAGFINRLGTYTYEVPAGGQDCGPRGRPALPVTPWGLWGRGA